MSWSTWFTIWVPTVWIYLLITVEIHGIGRFFNALQSSILKWKDLILRAVRTIVNCQLTSVVKFPVDESVIFYRIKVKTSAGHQQAAAMAMKSPSEGVQCVKLGHKKYCESLWKVLEKHQTCHITSSENCGKNTGFTVPRYCSTAKTVEGNVRVKELINQSINRFIGQFNLKICSVQCALRILQQAHSLMCSAHSGWRVNCAQHIRQSCWQFSSLEDWKILLWYL